MLLMPRVVKDVDQMPTNAPVRTLYLAEMAAMKMLSEPVDAGIEEMHQLFKHHCTKHLEYLCIIAWHTPAPENRFFDMLSNCQMLKVLVLRYVPLVSFGKILQVLDLPKLTCLRILDCPFRDEVGDDLQQLILGLAKNPTIESFALGQNLYHPTVAKSFAELLQQESNLTSLSWYVNVSVPMNDEAYREFVIAVSRNQSLKRLHLSGGANFTNCDTLAQVIRGENSLTHLTFENRFFSDDYEKIFHALVENTSLTSLRIVSCVINSNSMRIAELLAKCPNLTEIDISGNTDERTGLFKEVVDSLNRNCTLNKVNLSNCKKCSNPKQVRSIASVIRTSQLETIVCARCEISSEMVKELSDVLKLNRTLKSLVFDENNIGNQGVYDLCQALAQNNSVEELTLNGCGLKQTAGKAIGEMLSANQKLKSLGLRRNTLRDLGVQSIASSLENNFSLLKLDISGNLVKADGLAALVNALGTNSTLYRIWAEGSFSNDRTETLLSLLERNRKAFEESFRLSLVMWIYKNVDTSRMEFAILQTVMEMAFTEHPYEEGSPQLASGIEFHG
jgi:Ran GTPase-activating protein (RanGAP) involved in mRNA processing and transport